MNVEPRQFGRVNFEAFSFLGERLPNVSIDLVEVGGPQSLKRNINGTTATKVPFGLYEARVWSPGFKSARREFRLNDSEISIRVQLALSMECSVLHELGGVVGPLPSSRQLWVKVVPLQGVGSSEVPVNRSGYFRFSGLDDGQYLLLVVDEKEVVHTTTMTVPSAMSNMKIVLAKRAIPRSE